MKLRTLIAALALAVPVVATATPVEATVSGACQVTWYYNGSGYAYKMFSTCNVGTAHYAQRAHINCNNGFGLGVFQSRPGPYYGSTATCPSGGHAQGTSYIEFI